MGWIPESGNPMEVGMASTPAFLPGESHGERCLVGLGPWGCNELDKTKATACTHRALFKNLAMSEMGENGM